MGPFSSSDSFIPSFTLLPCLPSPYATLATLSRIFSWEEVESDLFVELLRDDDGRREDGLGHVDEEDS